MEKEKEKRKKENGSSPFRGGTTLPISRRINAELSSPPWALPPLCSFPASHDVVATSLSGIARRRRRRGTRFVYQTTGVEDLLSIRLIDNAATSGRPVDLLLSSLPSWILERKRKREFDFLQGGKDGCRFKVRIESWRFEKISCC